MECGAAGNASECAAHQRPLLACVAELRATNNRLNRRCQEAESAARTKVEEVLRAGPSLGRALSAWAAGDYRRRLEEAEKRIPLPKNIDLACSALEGILQEFDAQPRSPCLGTSAFPNCPCVRCRCSVVFSVLRGQFLVNGI